MSISLAESGSIQPEDMEPTESFARTLDDRNPLGGYRDRFWIPDGGADRPAIYFCGHSLGLQPKSVRSLLEQELDKWAGLGVRGHFESDAPWYTYEELLRDSAARLVGANRGEVVLMNSLTVNLHLMMRTFYQPRAGRYKILMDEPAFPSDLYAVKSQIILAGYDPSEALIMVRSGSGQQTISTDDIETTLLQHGPEIALVLFNGVNFLTGQLFDLSALVRLAKKQGCVVGFDLAHAAGNVVLQLHDWQADFAVWCHYKYLNCGPGAVAGCFVHERHGKNLSLPRLAGWWGNNPETRFRMQLDTEFVPQPGAAGWQISNPPIFALAPLRASYAIYDEVGMHAFCSVSKNMSSFLSYLLDCIGPGRLDGITPREVDQRGCQLSLRVRYKAREVLAALQDNGVVVDFREPDILRVAPVPLYNTFHEIWRFADILARVLR